MKFTNQNNKYIIKNVLIWREIMCCVTLLDGYIYDLAEFILNKLLSIYLKIPKNTIFILTSILTMHFFFVPYIFLDFLFSFRFYNGFVLHV